MAETVQEFFDGLAARADAEKTAGMNNSYLFEIEGAGEWLVTVQDGNVSVTEGGGEADTTITTSEETMLAVIKGEQNPTTAYMTGQAEDQGRHGRGDEVAEAVLGAARTGSEERSFSCPTTSSSCSCTSSPRRSGSAAASCSQRLCVAERTADDPRAMKTFARALAVARRSGSSSRLRCAVSCCGILLTIEGPLGLRPPLDRCSRLVGFAGSVPHRDPLPSSREGKRIDAAIDRARARSRPRRRTTSGGSTSSSGSSSSILVPRRRRDDR